MARRGDGLYLRDKTWMLDFRHQGARHTVRLGRHISRSVAREIAQVKRGELLKGEVGIGTKRKKDLAFDEAAKKFLDWTTADKKPNTRRIYAACLAERSLGSS